MALPDARVQYLYPLASNYYDAGTDVSLSPSVQNLGDAVLPPTLLAIYLSLDEVFDTTDILLTTAPIGGLSPQTASQPIVNFTLPSYLALGGYYLIAVADSAHAATEGNEENNASIGLHIAISDTQRWTQYSDTISLIQPFATVYAGGGDDVVFGSANIDTIYGDDGDDRIYGNAGSDQIYGGAGHDILVGDAGYDTLDGGDGNDVLSELYDPINSSNDTIYGGNGIDLIYSAGGDDTVYGGTDNANNYANLGDGDDTYQGAAGTDVVEAGAGVDRIIGGLGDDALYGGEGNDHMVGGAQGGSSLSPGSPADGIDLVSGGAGDDDMFGGGGNGLLVGDEGNDRLYGQGGIDVLYGGAGDDVVNGGPDVDGLFGGAGNDTFQVGYGYGCDYVWDFVANSTPGAASDQLVFQMGSFANATAVRAAATYASGNTTIIGPGSGNALVVLVGVNIANILDEDILVNGPY